MQLFKNDAIKDAFADHLESCRHQERFQLVAWVIMPDHVHLLLIPREDQTISMVLRSLKEPFARSVLLRWRQLDAPILAHVSDARDAWHFWQRGGGYDRNIISDDELHEKIAYIHANPVRRSLVDVETMWRWSSARWYAGDHSGPVQIEPVMV